MNTDDSLFSRLSQSVGPMAHLPNNGAAYHTGEQIITHLNRVLGPDGWSFHVLDHGQEEDSDECWAFGQLTALIDGRTVVKQDYGSQAMKRARSTGKFVSKGEDRKAAATDALKRCARLLGVGLDAWANERAPSWRPEQSEGDAPFVANAAPVAAQDAVTLSANGAAPSTPSSTDIAAETTLEAWQRLVKEAERVKLPTLGIVKAIDPNIVSEAQMQAHVKKLDARLEMFRKGAA